MVMNMYSDIDDEWSFTKTGDLKINYNYRQSIKHRLLCPLHYLNIYYENYGSNLYQQLGEKYNEEIVFEEVSNTLKQDVNIYNYEINSIDFIDGELILNLTINGDNVWFSYHIYDEINRFINVDCEIYYDNDWILNMILFINSNEYSYKFDLNDLYGNIENISYVNSEIKNEKISVELIMNGLKKILNFDLDGNILNNLNKKTIQLVWNDNNDENNKRPSYIICYYKYDGSYEYNVELNDNNNWTDEINVEEDGYWDCIEIRGYTMENYIVEDGITTIVLEEVIL